MEPGQRVRIIADPDGIILPGVILRTALGRLVAPDTRYNGFWLIWMDKAAVYHQIDGTMMALPCIREDENYLVPIDDA